MQELHVDASGSGSTSSAWDKHADAALLSEMAALLSPLTTSTATCSSSSFSFATAASLSPQALHTTSPRPVPATSVVTQRDDNDLDAAMVDVDQDLDMLHDMLDAQAQNPALRTEFQLASALASLVPPPASSLSPPIASTLASKSSRERQKSELDDLRAQVAQLEAELEKRKQQQQQQKKLVAAQTRSTALSGSSDSDSAATAWWASAAQRQIHERARVTADNAVLRDLAVGQLRLAKSLEKVLEKRRLCERAVLSASSLASVPSDVARDDSVAFAHLTRALEGRALTADAVFQAHGLNAITTDTIDAGIAHNDDATSTDLTIKVVKFHPFDFRAVDDACWHCLQSSNHAPSDGDRSVVVDANDTAVAIRCVLALQSNLPLLVRSVVRRVHEAERVVYSWETAVESLASPSHSSSARHSSIQITASGWGSIEPISLPSTSVACVTRHVAYARPTFETRGDAGARHVSSSSGALTDLLIASYLQRIESLHESIQDALLARGH